MEVYNGIKEDSLRLNDLDCCVKIVHAGIPCYVALTRTFDVLVENSIDEFGFRVFIQCIDHMKEAGLPFNS